MMPQKSMRERIVRRYLTAQVYLRYITAMDLEKWPPRKQLEMLKREREKVLSPRRDVWNNATNARNVQFYVGWPIDEYTNHDAKQYGFIIHAPNGKKFTAYDGADAPLLADWLRTETNYLELLDEKISAVNQSLRSEQLKKQQGKERVSGTATCSVCFGGFKYRGRAGATHPLIVLHGYLRPGFGYIEGNCPGVGYPPFELAFEGTEAFLAKLAAQLPKAVKELAYHKKRLREPTSKLTTVTINRRITRNADGTHKADEDTYTRDHPDWENVVRQYRQELEHLAADRAKFISELKAIIKDMKHRIATWVLRPLV